MISINTNENNITTITGNSITDTEIQITVSKSNIDNIYKNDRTEKSGYISSPILPPTLNVTGPQYLCNLNLKFVSNLADITLTNRLQDSIRLRDFDIMISCNYVRKFDNSFLVVDLYYQVSLYTNADNINNINNFNCDFGTPLFNSGIGTTLFNSGSNDIIINSIPQTLFDQLANTQTNINDIIKNYLSNNLIKNYNPIAPTRTETLSLLFPNYNNEITDFKMIIYFIAYFLYNCVL